MLTTYRPSDIAPSDANTIAYGESNTHRRRDILALLCRESELEPVVQLADVHIQVSHRYSSLHDAARTHGTIVHPQPVDNDV